jgi:predicted nucleotidyltransferase
LYVQIGKDVSSQLEKFTIATMFMGSHAHGTNTEDSDQDIIKIFTESNDECFNQDNGWQYKHENVDFNYQSLRTFIRNVVTGESPADFEALFGGWKLSSRQPNQINEIFELLKQNRSYALIKSYIGYAKKDANFIIKTLSTNQSDKVLDFKEIKNKTSHLYRGVETAKILMNDEKYIFCPGFEHEERHKYVRRLKKNVHSSRIELIDFVSQQLNSAEEIRVKINLMLDNKQIQRRFDLDKLKQIDMLFKQFKQNNEIDYGNSRYQIMEKGLTFQYT